MQPALTPDPAPGPAQPKVSLRLTFPGGVMFGPGKADLLEQIAATGSISAAGRAMSMSYKRAWLLVEALNAGFATPLVESARGGAKGGGASLTPAGAAVLAHYRALVAGVSEDQSAHLSALSALLTPEAQAVGGK